MGKTTEHLSLGWVLDKVENHLLRLQMKMKCKYSFLHKDHFLYTHEGEHQEVE